MHSLSFLTMFFSNVIVFNEKAVAFVVVVFVVVVVVVDVVTVVVIVVVILSNVVSWGLPWGWVLRSNILVFGCRIRRTLCLSVSVYFCPFVFLLFLSLRFFHSFVVSSHCD